MHWHTELELADPIVLLGDKRAGGKEISWIGPGKSEIKFDFIALILEEVGDLTAIKQSKTLLTDPKSSYKYTSKSVSCSDEETLIDIAALNRKYNIIPIPVVCECSIGVLLLSQFGKNSVRHLIHGSTFLFYWEAMQQFLLPYGKKVWQIWWIICRDSPNWNHPN